MFKIVEYSTPGCVSCRLMKTVLNVLVSAHEDSVQVEFKDVSELESTDDSPQKLPIIDIFNDDQLVVRKAGIITQKDLEEILESC